MELPEPRWAVEELLPEGLCILAGPPKLGKSWLALQIALAVAGGQEALAGYPTAAGAALYLGLEGSMRRLQSRVRKLLGGRPVPPGLHLAREWPRQDKGGWPALIEWLKGHDDARLVVVDTWARFRPGRRPRADAYEEDYAHAAEAKQLADQRGVCLTIVHHTRKSPSDDPLDRISGTLGLPGAADAVMVLRRERGQADGTLFVSGRDVEERELAVGWSAETGRWSVLGSAADFRRSRERKAIIEAIRAAGKPLTPSELAAAVGKGAEAVKALLWKMRGDGEVRADGRGEYSLPSVSVYPVYPGDPGDGVDPVDRASVNGKRWAEEGVDPDDVPESPFD
jgi:hypothetical protein